MQRGKCCKVTYDAVHEVQRGINNIMRDCQSGGEGNVAHMILVHEGLPEGKCCTDVHEGLPERGNVAR